MIAHPVADPEAQHVTVEIGNLLHILDAIGDEFDCIGDRATLYSSTEFKKIRLLYFTEDFKDWEREVAGV